MDGKEIIIAWLKEHNCDGLCDVDHECGCSIDDLVLCDGPMLSCVPAKLKKCKECKEYNTCEGEAKAEDGECFVEADITPTPPPGCGKPGHVMAPGDEGTSHCATCEGEAELTRLKAVGEAVERLPRYLPDTDGVMEKSEYGRYIEFDCVKQALKGEEGGKDKVCDTCHKPFVSLSKNAYECDECFRKWLTNNHDQSKQSPRMG